MPRLRFSVPAWLLGVSVNAALLAGSGPARGALPTDFSDELLTSAFVRPVGLAFLPDGRILVVEQMSGNVRLMVNFTGTASPLTTLTDVNTAGNEQGLLGIAVDPDWPARPYAYLYFDRTPGNAITIARFTATGDLTDSSSANLSLGSRYDLLTDIPDVAPNHNGGTLRFGPDGMLYASLGDDASPCYAQDVNRLQGKILRLRVYSLPDTGFGPPPKALLTPPDNPFVGQGANAGLVYCLGLRNPFRFTIDRLTGRLNIADVGADMYEEVSEARAGSNLGWPFREGHLVRTPPGCTEPGGTGTQNYTPPIAYYSHAGQGSLSVIGGLLYRPVSGGTRNFPALYDGGVFYADFYVGFWRVVKRNLQGVWAPLGPVPGQPDPTNWATAMNYTSDMRVGPDGAIYYCDLIGNTVRRILYTGVVTGTPGTEPSGGSGLCAFPNPLQSGAGETDLGLEGLAGSGPARVELFDVRGRATGLRFDLPSGGTSSRIPWTGRDGAGRVLSPGVYFLRVTASAGARAARLVLLP